MATKEQILGAPRGKIVSVETPEWGCNTDVKAICGTARDEYEAATFSGDKPNLADMRARLCAVSIVGDNGKLLFSQSELRATPAEIAVVGALDAAPLDRCFQAAKKLAGIGAGAVEEAEKNSAPGPSDDSPSA